MALERITSVAFRGGISGATSGHTSRRSSLGVRGTRSTRTRRSLSASSTAEATTAATGSVPGLAHALEPQRVQRRGCLEVVDLDGRDVVAARQRVVHVAGGERLPGLVVADLLEERAADAERDRALDLALDDRRIDEPTAVVTHPVAAQPHAAASRRSTSASTTWAPAEYAMSGGWKKCVASSPGATPCAAVAIAATAATRPSSIRCSGLLRSREALARPAESRPPRTPSA